MVKKLGIRDKVLSVLEENKGKTVSGGEMAAQLHVSRNAVWKVVRELREMGYQIHAVPNRGYCLAQESAIFSSQSIAAGLNRSDLRVEIYPELDSTNRLVKERGECGEKEGLIVVANRQTMGRGRKGKSFFSPASGLYISFLLRPKIAAEDALLITTASAVAVSRAIESVFQKKCEIKWVNDIYINGKKVCGILTEASLDFEGGGLFYAVPGIGVNLSDPEGGFPEELQEIACSLMGNKPCPEEKKIQFVSELCNQFFCVYDSLPQKDFMKEYRQRSFLIGKYVNVLHPSGNRQARVLDVDENAHLVVEYSDGQQQALSSGDVSVKGV
jgi:BirA family biotin operon repressor/biotin-[acetyl-CoA-carboxylase] ligase